MAVRRGRVHGHHEDTVQIGRDLAPLLLRHRHRAADDGLGVAPGEQPGGSAGDLPGGARRPAGRPAAASPAGCPAAAREPTVACLRATSTASAADIVERAVRAVPAGSGSETSCSSYTMRRGLSGSASGPDRLATGRGDGVAPISGSPVAHPDTRAVTSPAANSTAAAASRRVVRTAIYLVQTVKEVQLEAARPQRLDWVAELRIQGMETSYSVGEPLRSQSAVGGRGRRAAWHVSLPMPRLGEELRAPRLPTPVRLRVEDRPIGPLCVSMVAFEPLRHRVVEHPERVPDPDLAGHPVRAVPRAQRVGIC